MIRFKITIHATGSKGNAYSIIDGEHKLLIDPGIPIKELQKKTGFSLSKYDLCLLSHEHKDHSKSIADVAALGVTCCCSNGTYNALGKMFFDGPMLKAGHELEIENWKVLPFEVQHDAAEPLGFLIKSPSGKIICYATDTYYIKYAFTGVNYWMVEANYSEDILQKNDGLSPALKKRIRTSHFEIGNVVEFFKTQDLSATERIYLIHLSDDNSDEKEFVEAVQKITGKPAYVKPD